MQSITSRKSSLKIDGHGGVSFFDAASEHYMKSRGEWPVVRCWRGHIEQPTKDGACPTTIMVWNEGRPMRTCWARQEVHTYD